MNCLRPFFFIALCLFLTLLSHGQLCSTTGFKPASSFTNNSLIGNSHFLNTNNAKEDDGIRAISWATLSILGNAKTQFLTATGFNFSVPPTATICGVSASIKKRATGINVLNWITDEQVKLVKGGVITGNNKASNTSWAFYDRSENYGGTTDSWGTTLTAADVNSAQFGVAVAADYHGVLGALLSAEIDYIQVQVHYNSVLPLLLQSFDCRLSNHTIVVQWSTEAEEEDATIYLQRSGDGMVWNTIKKYRLKNNHSKQKYEYKDALENAGKFHYRLQMEHRNGTVSYSQTSVVSYEGSNEVKLFPNPASNWLKISSVNQADQIQLFNLYQQAVPIVLKWEGNHLFIDVSKLSKGIYFVKVNNVVKRFVKE